MLATGVASRPCHIGQKAQQCHRSCSDAPSLAEFGSIPLLRADVARSTPSRTRAMASMRRTTRQSLVRLAMKRNSRAEISGRVMAIARPIYPSMISAHTDSDLPTYARSIVESMAFGAYGRLRQTLKLVPSPRHSGCNVIFEHCIVSCVLGLIRLRLECFEGTPLVFYFSRRDVV